MKVEGYLITFSVIALIFAGGFYIVNSSKNASSTSEESIQLNNSQTETQTGDTSTEQAQTNLPVVEPPPMTIDPKKTYTVILKTTVGDITIELNSKMTPKTANNFVTLAKKKFYDFTIFHRTIKGFMIQGGDPKGDGTGGPGYKFADEKFEGKYTRGTVAMANSGPNTNGSQFFIMHADYDLPPNYTIFGKVVQGMDIVDKIAEAPTDPSGEGSRPVNPVKITSVEVSEK